MFREELVFDAARLHRFGELPLEPTRSKRRGAPFDRCEDCRSKRAFLGPSPAIWSAMSRNADFASPDQWAPVATRK
jgi:hypothetical protein